MSDIAEVLDRVKKNIDIVESGRFDNSILDEISYDFEEMFETIKMFLISERDIYYGYILMNLQFSVNFYSNSIACILLNSYPPVFETNPLLLGKFSLKEIIYIVCHEIDHIVFNHPSEMVKCNPTNNAEIAYKFNLAADAAVNDRINHEIAAEKHLYMKEPDGLITSKVLGKMFDIKRIKALQNYKYYFDLIRHKNNEEDFSENGAQKIMDSIGNGAQKIMDSIEDGCDGNGDQNKSEKSGSYPSLSPVTAKNCTDIVDHNWKQSDDEEETREIVKELLNSSNSMINSDSRGILPGYFLEAIEEINKAPVLSWEKILKKYIGTISADRKKTRTRLNRRQPERFDLSGSVNDKVLKIVVAIDTSGSVSNDMIAKIFTEIFSILGKRKRDITVIECDSKVQKVYKVLKPNDIQKKVAGRGGTAFTPVINYINKERYYRDALLIYFTDGFGEYSIPKPKTYRNIWVILDNENNLSLKEPYGVKIKL